MNLAIYLIVFISTFNVFAEQDKSIDLVRWDVQEGVNRLERSKYKRDFFPLANNYIGQPNGIACGPTAGAIVLNALRIRDDSARKKMPFTYFSKKYKKHIPKSFDPRFKRYTPHNFLNGNANKVKNWSQVYGQPIEGKKDFGYQLRQFHKALKAHGVKSKIRVVDNKLSDNTIKKEMVKNLETSGDYVIVNYARKSLNQKGGGHISPLGAYDDFSDSFLILDVNPNKDKWVWVKSSDLFAAMRTFDTVENRGYLLVTK